MTIFVIFRYFLRIFGAKPETGDFVIFLGYFFRISRLEGFLYSSETGRIRFRGARFQTPNSVSFSGLIEFWGANSVSSSQPIICVPKRTHRVFCRTHRVCRGTQWGLVSSLLRNSTLETVFRPFPNSVPPQQKRKAFLFLAGRLTLNCLGGRFGNFLYFFRSGKSQNESFPNFSNFRPEFCPEFCSEFFPKFSRTFRASFRGRRTPDKIHQKSPPFFNAKFQGKHEKNIHKILLESRQSNISFLLGRGGSPRHREGWGGGGVYWKSRQGGCPGRGAGRVSAVNWRILWGGGGLNIFFRGRNVHQALERYFQGYHLGTEEVFQ